MAEVYVHAIRNELDYWPGARVEFSLRSKHAQAVLHYGGGSRFVVIPSTPGDSRRGALNSLTDVRKELTALGASRVVRKPVVRKRTHKVIGTKMPRREPLPHVGRAPVRSNPFDALAAMTFEPAPQPKLSWWRRLLRFIASAAGAGTAKTAQPVEGEARQSGAQSADAQPLPPSQG